MHGPLLESTIREGLHLDFLARRLVLRETTGSTNDDAWAYLSESDADGTVVLAEQQLSGKGRLGRCWVSPRGASLLVSVLLVDHEPERLGPALGLAAAISVHDAILDVTGIACPIKWPNDVLIRGRKVAGVLVESRRSGTRTLGFVVGIGINCLQHRAHFPDELQDRATSLEMESEAPVDRVKLLRALLIRLDHWLQPRHRHDVENIRTAWLARAVPIGHRIHLAHDRSRFSGQVIDIDPLANLVVQLDQGGRRLFNAVETTVLEGHEP